MDWNKFLNFDQLITPSVIKFIYILSSLGVVIYFLFALPGGPYGISPGWRILGILLSLFGVRLYCELMIVMFKISENTSIMANNTDNTDSE